MFGDMSLAGAVLTVVFVLLLAYWCSRLLGKNWMRSSSGKHIKIIEQLQIGPDKQLLLVKLQERVYFLGVSQAGIQLLSLVEGELTEVGPEKVDRDGEVTPGFHALLKKYASLHEKKRKGDK